MRVKIAMIEYADMGSILICNEIARKLALFHGAIDGGGRVCDARRNRSGRMS